MYLKIRLFLFLFLFGVFIQTSSICAITDENEHSHRDVVLKIRTAFEQYEIALKTVIEKREMRRDKEITISKDVRSHMSGYWRAIRSDILRGGTEADWLLLLKKLEILTDADVLAVQSRYRSLCQTLNQEKFFGEFDRLKECNPRDLVFKSPEFLRRFFDEDATSGQKDIYLPLVVQEWTDFQFFKGNFLKKSLDDGIKTLTTLSSEVEIDWFFVQCYRIYWKWRIFRLFSDKKADVPDFYDLPSDIRQRFKTHADLCVGSSLEGDLKQFLERIGPYLKTKNALAECRQKAYSLGFYCQFEFFEDLEKVVALCTGRLMYVHGIFFKLSSMKNLSPPEEIATTEQFNDLMNGMREDLRNLKKAFEKKPEAQADIFRISYSLDDYEEVLRQEVSSFSPENLKLYAASLQDFYLYGWPSIQSDIIYNLPLSIEKSAFRFESEHMLSKRKEFQEKIFELEEQLMSLKKQELQHQEELKALNDRMKTLTEEQKNLEQANRDLKAEMAKKQPSEEDLLRKKLLEAQEKLKRFKESSDRNEQATQKSIKALKAQELELKEELAKFKNDFSSRLKFELEKVKKSLQRAYDAKIEGLTKNHQTSLDVLRKQYKDLLEEKEGEKKNAQAFLQGCFQLFQEESLPLDNFGEKLYEKIAFLKAEADRLKAENQEICAQAQVQEESIRKRFDDELAQRWKLEKEKLQKELETSMYHVQQQLEDLRQKVQKTSEEKQQLQELFETKRKEGEAERARMMKELLDQASKTHAAEERAADERAVVCRSSAYQKEMEKAYQAQIAQLKAEIAALQYHLSMSPAVFYNPQAFGMPAPLVQGPPLMQRPTFTSGKKFS
ncbi:MAG: hypothetical protein JSS34_02325 [Proteobacteria bacterium]|nr:hypothetical protein [Pseudomonadota bacterium]